MNWWSHRCTGWLNPSPCQRLCSHTSATSRLHFTHALQKPCFFASAVLFVWFVHLCPAYGWGRRLLACTLSLCLFPFGYEKLRLVSLLYNIPWNENIAANSSSVEGICIFPNSYSWKIFSECCVFVFIKGHNCTGTILSSLTVVPQNITFFGRHRCVCN